MSLKAIGYIRRSKESEARTVSLEDKSDKIQEYCEDKGWTLCTGRPLRDVAG